MKLDSEKKVLLCQKALYAKQLAHYKNLCKIYKSLADVAIRKGQLKAIKDEPLAAQVQKLYGEDLTKAAKGDLSFIRNNTTTKHGYIEPIYTQEQLTLFQKFADSVSKISLFKEASEKLHTATYDGDRFDVDPELMDEYHKFMQGNNETKSFDNFIAENPKRWVGHIFYEKSKSSIETIKKIDPNHLVALNQKSLTPKSFAASISGARGTIDRTPIQEKLSNEFEQMYSDKEHEKYDKDENLGDVIGVAAYRAAFNAKESIKQVYKAHKGTLQKALKKAAILALSLGMVTAGAKGISAAKDAIEFNSTSAYTNADSGYVQTIDDETMQTLKGTDVLIENLKSSTSTPTKEELQEVRSALDNEIDLVIEDLVRKSFEEQYPNLTIIENGVETHYDKKDVDPENGISGNYIYITCQDVNGKVYNYTITDFSSQGENRTNTSFDNEYALDYELNRKISSSDTQSYDKNTKTVTDIIKEFEQIHQDTLDLAGSDAVVEIPQAAYDNAKAVDKESVFDLLKAKYSHVSIWALKPNFKLVIPEREQTQESSTLSSETNTGNTTEKYTNDGDER